MFGRPHRTSVIALVVAALVATGCAGDAGDAGEGAGDQANLIDVTEDADVKPEFEVPDQDPPTELVTETVVEGDGQTAQAGDTVRVHYVGKSWSTGEQFEASWDGGDPFEFQLGAGQVIQGWDQGVAGMRVGGRRTLIIPPDLGYGSRGGGPIAPNETLVFVVDLLAVS